MRPAMFSVLLINFVRGFEAFEVPALIGVREVFGFYDEDFSGYSSVSF